MDNVSNIILGIIIALIIIFALVGIAVISSGNEFPEKINYFENGIKLDAIQYQNKIYLYKGE